MGNKQLYIDFESYQKAPEPDKREKAEAWRAAIGLQQVDGLTVSDYLKETAVRNIEGELTIDEVKQQLQSYYEAKVSHDKDDSDTEEADKVSANIAKLLEETSFSLTAREVLSLHKHIFDGVFKHAGEIRTYDITKKEWVLQGMSVSYGRAEDIMAALNYDIQQERDFDYTDLDTDGIINHIVDFVSLLWQNHPFCEGNTRTTAVFIIKYLRSCGFNVNNDLFAENSWYFRNALVRANYNNPLKGVKSDRSFLVKFFKALLLGEQFEFINRNMYIGAEIEPTPTSTPTSKDENTPTSTPSSSTGTPSSKILLPKSDNVLALIICIAKRELSIKEMMTDLALKDRPNFLTYSVTPAIENGYVRMKYPDSPRHPRQRYILTIKGLMVIDLLTKSGSL